MYKIDDEISVYSDYDHTIYLPSYLVAGLEYRFTPKINDEPQCINVKWGDLMRLKNAKAFTQKRLRFPSDIEEEVVKELKLIYDRESYDINQIRSMIINVTDDVIKEILEIKNLTIAKAFLSQLIYLKNTNVYNISSKLELYIRARVEELSEGLRVSELEGQESADLKSKKEDKDTNEEKKTAKATKTKKDDK